MRHKPEVLKSSAIALAVLASFVVVSLLARQYEDAIGAFVREGGALGPILFVLITAVGITLLIPLDVTLLIPLAIVIWGSLATALLSVVGWTIGSGVSFYLARRYGRPFVERVFGEKRVGAASAHVPKTHLFWWVLGAEALVQVDFIAYVFGLFTEIRFKTFLLAVALGDLVPAFFFAYVGGLPFWYELAAVFTGLAITALLFWRFVGRAERH